MSCQDRPGQPYAFSQAIAEIREAGDEAVIITVGAKLSGTNQSARTALAEAPGGDVYVVDSNNVTLGERILVEYALRLVDEGRSAAQIAAAVEAVRDRVVVIGLLETLEYLVRGGRLSAAAGAVGTLLNVKPVVAAEDGLIVQLGKARGSKNGRNLLNQKVEKAGGIDFSMPLALGYTGLSDAVLKKYIEDSAALWAGHTENEPPIHTIGATIGTHVGPGAVAVAFFRPPTSFPVKTTTKGTGTFVVVYAFQGGRERSMASEGFFERVYEVVEQIPEGMVATYGQVALLAGRPRSARYVGYALHSNPRPGQIPCHRVVFADGRICEGFAFGGPDAQRELLMGEGVTFADPMHVDLGACRWPAGL